MKIAELEPLPSRSRTIRRSSIAGAVRAWLREREDVVGADKVRTQLALAVAADLDRDDLPAYARAKLSTELRALVAEIEGPPPAVVDTRDVRRVLAEVGVPS